MSADQLAPLQPTTCGGAPPALGLPGIQQVMADEGGSNARRYRDRNHNFSILLPWSWSAKAGLQQDLELLATPKLNGASNKDRVSLSISSQPFPRSIDLDLYYDTALQLLQVKIPNSRIISQGNYSLCGVPVRWALFNYSTASGQETALWQHYFLAHNGQKAYAISASTDKAAFFSYRPLFESIIQSFREEYPRN